MTRVLDGRAVARAVRAAAAERAAELAAARGRPPCLAAVVVGDDPASAVYVRSKGRALERAGCASRTLALPASTGEAELLARLDRLNEDDAVDGILVQLPLPPAIGTHRVLDRVDPAKDVDGFHVANVGRLWLDRPGFAPATPAGIVELLERSGIEVEGLEAVVVGRSRIVGKPLAALLLRRNATVTICHSRTRDLAAVCRRADLLVSAIGRPAAIGPEHVAEGAVVVDVGINRIADPSLVERLYPGDESRRRRLAERGSILTGDVDFHRVAPRTRAITPVPGGVGPMTVAMVLANTVEAAERRHRAAAGRPRGVPA